MGWFLYDIGLRHERVNIYSMIFCIFILFVKLEFFLTTGDNSYE